MTDTTAATSSTPEEVVGYRLRHAREAMGATQQQLGEWLAPLLGKPWPRQAIYAAEQGKRSLTATEVMALSRVLGIAPAALFSPPAETTTVAFPAGSVAVDDLFLAGGPALVMREALRQAATLSQDIASQAACIHRLADKAFM